MASSTARNMISVPLPQGTTMGSQEISIHTRLDHLACLLADMARLESQRGSPALFDTREAGLLTVLDKVGKASARLITYVLKATPYE
jgi:hypothetical protein